MKGAADVFPSPMLRERRINATALTSFVVFLANAVSTVVVTKMVLTSLGSERFGVWATINSFIPLLAFLDLGVAQSMISLIAEADGRQDSASVSKLVTNALFTTSALAVFFCIIFFCVQPLVAWEYVFSLSSQAIGQEAANAVCMFGITFLITLPLGISQSVWLGYQQGAVANGFRALGSILAMTGITVAVQYNAGLGVLVLIGSGSLALSFIVSLMVLLCKRPYLLPKASNISIASTKKLMRLGLMFFGLQFAGGVGFHSNNLIAAHFVGAYSIPELTVCSQLFSVVPLFVSFFLAPLWPAYREAQANHDLAWIRRTFFKSMRYSVLFTVPATAVLLLSGKYIVGIWVGESVSPSWAMLISLAIWNVTVAFSGPIAMLLNGIDAMRLQVGLAMSMVVVNVALSIWLSSLFGNVGVVYGSSISLFFCIVIPSGFFLCRSFKRNLNVC